MLFVGSAENKRRVEKLFPDVPRDKLQAEIKKSQYGRDYSLKRQDVCNIAVLVQQGTYRRHTDDATSMRMLVRLLHNCCALSFVL